MYDIVPLDHSGRRYRVDGDFEKGVDISLCGGLGAAGAEEKNANLSQVSKNYFGFRAAGAGKKS